MKMKCSILLTLNYLFTIVVLASPHRHHHNLHHVRNMKREEVGPVVWVTEMVSVVKTVQVTSTVWITPNPPEPTPPNKSMEEKYVPKSSVDSPIPEEFHETPALYQIPEENTQNTDSMHHNKSNQSGSQITPVSEIIPQELDHLQKEPEAPPKKDNPSPTSVDSNVNESKTSTLNDKFEPTLLPGTSETEPKSPQPESSPSQAQSVPENSKEVQNYSPFKNSYGSGNERCSNSSPCSGDITYYDPGVGYGACGWQSTKDEPVVALPHEFMGLKSNGNKYCGKTITIEHDGKRSTAKVVDKCMGCSGFSIDLSDAAFTKLSSLSVGRTGAKWWINP